MITKRTTVKRGVQGIYCTEELVPQNHILREIDAAVDFSFIYELTKDMYSNETGRPSVDPIVLFKIVIIQYLFGIKSMRQTIKEIEVNIAYRWFIGYELVEKIPHFSTFGKNYSRRFQGTDIFEKIFKIILEKIVEHKFINSESIFIDATHIKASANNKKSINEVVEVETKIYQNLLNKEINEDREMHNKKPLSNIENTTVETKNIKKSKVDSDAGVFHKGEHQKCFAYVSNTACDKNNFILGFEVTSGNVHDSISFDTVYEKTISAFPQVKNIVVDRGYKTPWIIKRIIDDNRVPITPYKRPMGGKGLEFRKNAFIYDEYYDCYLCPNNEVLNYTTTTKHGKRQYLSTSSKCVNCPVLNKCTTSKNNRKLIERHIWENYMEQAEDYRFDLTYKEIYKLRNQTIERIFADAKEKHGMRYTQLRGLQKVKMQITLTFACMNLKKFAKWLKKSLSLLLINCIFNTLIVNFLILCKKMNKTEKITLLNSI